MIGIMIVEDSPVTMEYLELELEKAKHKYKIMCKFRGVENVEPACESGRINIVLMDVCLGDSSGLDLARKIKQSFVFLYSKAGNPHISNRLNMNILL